MADITSTVTAGISVIYRGLAGFEKQVVVDVTTASGMTTAVGGDTWIVPYFTVVTYADAIINTTGLGAANVAAVVSTVNVQNVVINHLTTQGSGGVRVRLWGR